MNKIPSRGVAVISNRTVCGVFDFKPAMFAEKKFLQTLNGVVVYCLTHLTDLPLSSNCQNLFIFIKPSIITFFLKTNVASNLCQAVNARSFPFSLISNLTIATRTVRDPVSPLVFQGAWSNGCNMEEVEEVIEPTTECIIDCVGGGGTTGIKTNLGV